VVADVMQRGIHLVGGGALIRGLDSVIQDTFKIPVYIAHDPLTAIARGTGIILENLKDFEEVLILNEDELPPKK
jgi:rod shape-determining protein MreB